MWLVANDKVLSLPFTSDPSSMMVSTVEDSVNTPEARRIRPPVRSSPIKAPLPTLDIHKRDEWSKHIYPHVNNKIENKEMLSKLSCTGDPGNGLAPQPGKMTKSKPNADKSTYCNYLNKLSAMVRKRTSAPYTIKFIPRGSRSPLFHPNRTSCRPDIVAVRLYPAPHIPSEASHWSHLEATGEEDSGKSLADGGAQEGAYTAYHLQARPDLVSVVGIYVCVSGFTLFFSNAGGVHHTALTIWSSGIGRRILYAWMWHLYHPHIDPSITVDMKTSATPTFTINTTDGKTYDKLVVLRAGESIGRRTIVLARPDSSIVVKEQYIEEDRRFREGPLLEKMHKDGRFPGVVRLEHYEYVMNGDGKICVKYPDDEPEEGGSTTTTRFKVRLVLKDKGTGLADVKTPRQLLMSLYDVMEISRILWTKCQMFHRDISPANLLLYDGPSTFTEPLRGDLGDMCFSEYLLSGSAGQDDPESDSVRQRRLTTRVLLIDFDSGENQDPDDTTLGDPMARTGTPIFMARMVRSNIYPEGTYTLPRMPAIASELEARYKRTLPKRLDAFPTNEDEFIQIGRGKKMLRNEFRHLLRYDAESVFWYLLWWSMQAKPVGKLPKGATEEKIPNNYWSALIGKEDMRDDAFIKGSPARCLHSSYSKLGPLLDDMSEHLRGDLNFSKDVERKVNPEYMHEVFQRLILNFLVSNEAEPFMDIEKDEAPRSVETTAMSRTGNTLPRSSNKRSRDAYLLEDPEVSNAEPTNNKRQRMS